eukprot:TRINITY_DN1077_c0_g1_i1.p1 TRINITY_DN1077_c0_g1~~TRINITY_DN1077_c0_g1_i1.p1  ORF type:complete len:258 (+),score=36.84 TRINITY_DN1077_c0_g1_i1:287-1060(+)
MNIAKFTLPLSPWMNLEPHCLHHSKRLFTFQSLQADENRNLRNNNARYKSIQCFHELPSRIAYRNGRRDVLCHMTILLLALSNNIPLSRAAESGSEEDYWFYKDDKEKFSLLVPPNWVKGEGRADGERTVTAFCPENETMPNISVVVTGVGADYTRMESFGTVDAFAETLVNSLDRSWQRPPGQEAKLSNAKSKNGLYFVEYSLRKPGERKIHLISAIGLGIDVWYNKLYTATGQYLEDDSKYKSQIEKSVSSFRIS